MSNETKPILEFPSNIEFDYYDNCKSTTPSKTITLLVFLNWIRNGEFKEQIEDIRGTKDKDARSAKKKGLPAATVSARFFPTRNIKNLVGHTGLIQIDLDDVEDILKVLGWLLKDPYTLACFISPSGNGIKIIVRIPPNAKTHRASFRALRRYYREKYGAELDDACSDVSRLFYVSYDPNIFVNFEASEFAELEQAELSQAIKEPITNSEDEALTGEDIPHFKNHNPTLDVLHKEVEIVIGRILEAKKDITASYKDWLSIGFAFANEFNEAGRHFFHDVSRFHPTYNSIECDKQYNICLQGNGQGININTFFFLAKKGGINIRTDHRQGMVIESAEQLNRVVSFSIERLYKAKKDQDGNVKDLIIQHIAFLALIKTFGIRRFDLDNGFIFVRVEDNVIEEVSRTNIQDIFFLFLKSLPYGLPEDVSREFLLEKFTKSPENFFSDTKLSLMDAETQDFCKDDSKAAYIFYKNGFVKCMDGGYSLHQYRELNGLVWKRQILKRDFDPVPMVYTNMDSLPVFVQFIKNVCGEKTDRFNSFCSIIGYILHDYFEGKLKAVILSDSDITNNTNGRTGKTLFAKAIGKISPLCEMNGKDFDPEDRFKYQDVMLADRLVHLNDIKQSLSIEKLFNDITEGISVQKKNKQPFRKRVKFILSTNKTLKIEGASAKDRVIEFEFVNHYGESFSPRDEFGKWFFGEGWTTQDWSEFDNFICYCLTLYLKEGLILPSQINLNRKKLLESTNEDFVDYIEERVKDGRIKANEIICKNDIRNDFINSYPDYKHELMDVRKITQWLRNYANLSGYFAQNNPRQDEKAANGKKYFVFRAQDYKRSTSTGACAPL